MQLAWNFKCLQVHVEFYENATLLPCGHSEMEVIFGSPTTLLHQNVSVKTGPECELSPTYVMTTWYGRDCASTYV